MNILSLPEYQKVLGKRVPVRFSELKHLELDEQFCVIFANGSVTDDADELLRLNSERPLFLDMLNEDSRKKFLEAFAGTGSSVTVPYIIDIETISGRKLLCYASRSRSRYLPEGVYDIFLSDNADKRESSALLAGQLNTSLAFERALDYMALPSVMLADSRILYTNCAFAQRLGFKLSVLHGMKLSHLTDMECRERLNEMIRRVSQGECPAPVNVLMPMQNGGVFAAKVYGALRHSDAETFVLLCFEDISPLIKEHKENEFYRSLFMKCPINMLVIEIEKRTVTYNEKLAKTVGVAVDEIKTLNDMCKFQHVKFGDSTSNAFYSFMHENREGNIFESLRTIDGRVIPVKTTIRKINDTTALVMMTDYSYQLETEQLLEAQRTKDFLTGVFNSEYFYTRLSEDFNTFKATGRNLCMLMFKLDSFEEIMYSAGPQTANAILKLIAIRVRSYAAKNTNFARLGETRFALTFAADGEEEVRDYVEGFMDILDWPFVYRDRDFLISISAGVASYPADALEYLDLVKFSFQALRGAQREKRSSYAMFTREHGLDVRSHKNSLEVDLTNALESDEFVVYLQPKADIGTDEIVEGEALIRWESPIFGTVMPSTFIKLAEDTGMILPLGYKVIELVCRFQKHCREAGLKQIKISINLSFNQIMDDEFEEKLRRILGSYGVDGSLLEFEISESIATIDASSGVLSTIKHLRELGIVVCIDNFGTGRTSIPQLSEIPLERLTIDRSLMNGCEEDADKREKIKQTIILAEKLGLKTIAEGVENKKQLELLRSLGCNYYQGYYLSKPVPSEEFERFLK